MKNKKVIVIAGAAAVLLIAVCIGVVAMNRNSGDYTELDAEGRDDYVQAEVGIDSDFDESENESYDDEYTYDADLDETQTEPDGEYYVNHTSDELLAKLRSQMDRDIPQMGKDSFDISDNSEDEAFYDDFEDDDFEDDDFEEDGEIADASEIGVVVYESKGYAQDEVLCNADSQEEAESVAAQISGTLLSWEHGVAAIRIGTPVDDLLESLEQQGSSLNLYRRYYY